MAKPLKPFLLSSMTGGVNRYEQEAGPQQTVDALDVVQDDGDLRRRDAFNAFQGSAPFTLAGGKVYVKSYDYTGQTWTDYTDRLVTSMPYTTLGAQASGNKERLFIGCDDQFQGIEFARMKIDSGSFGSAATVYARIRFVTSNWVDSSDPASDTGLYETCPWVFDTTIAVNGTAADKIQPLRRSGRIFWHKSGQPTDASGDDNWSAVTVDSQSAYWIILDFSTSPQNPDEAVDDTDYTIGVSGETFSMEPPGFMCFQLKPVTGIFPLGQKSKGHLLLSSFNPERYGQESGPQLGIINSDKENCHLVGIHKDGGAGMIGTMDTSGWEDAGPPVQKGWTGSSVGPGADTFEKNDTTYNWQKASSGTPPPFHGSWGFPVLATGISPAASPSATTTTFTAVLGASYDTEFEDCIMVCTAAGTGGPTAGRYNRIKTSTVSGSNVAFTFSNAWNNTPATDSEFTVLGIPHRLTVIENDLDSGSVSFQRPWLEIVKTSASSAHQLDIHPEKPDGSTAIDDRQDINDMSIDDSHVIFSIVKEARYELPGEEYPDWTFDQVTRSFIFAFGNYPIQRWDGFRMRQLLALSASTDLVVQEWTGKIVEKFAGQEDDPGFQKNAFLRSAPPEGKYVQNFANRLFIAGIPGDPSRVAYSAPGAFNDLWPKGYETLVRDPEGSAIVGMNILNDELVVFTKSSIYASPPPDDLGYMQLTPRSPGLGFINNRVVHRVPIKTSSVLMGANQDGIYAYTGAEPIIVLDEWERVIEGGVNKSTMHKACAAVSYYENCYYIAVPSQHASDPNRIIRYNWIDQTMYVWSAPFGGVTAMALDRDDNGNELLIFGHADGTISRLEASTTDDGSTITGRAKTALFSAGGMTMAVSGYMVTLEDTGASGSVTIKEYLNQDDGDPNTLYAGAFNGGSAELDTMVLDTDKLASQKKKTKRINAKSGTRAETIQLEITGTGRWKMRSIEALLVPKGQRSQ